jgi:hypothetical protein
MRISYTQLRNFLEPKLWETAKGQRSLFKLKNSEADPSHETKALIAISTLPLRQLLQAAF